MVFSISIVKHNGKKTRYGPMAGAYLETIVVARGLYQFHENKKVSVWLFEKGDENGYIIWEDGIFLSKKETVKS